MVGVIRITATHNRVCDGGIDFDSGDAGASIRDGAKYVYASTWADDGIVSVWPESVDYSRGLAHQIPLPF